MYTYEPGQGDMEIEVGPSHGFTEGARALVRAGQRNIAVYLYKGKFYAIDNACYHHGGPLHNGDIEEMGGHPCVLCPWHSYRIALDTGEGLYVGLDLAAKKECVKSKGIKQRVHPVIVKNGKVFVQVRTGGPSVESDTYATMAIANQEQPTSKPSTATNLLRNIHSKGHGGHAFEREQSLLSKEPSAVSPCEHTIVQCIAKRYVSADKSVLQLVFDKVSGNESKDQLRPGMWVTLELPLSDSEKSLPSIKTEESNTLVNRTYTVLQATSNGRSRHTQGWFAVAVKDLSRFASVATKGQGSRWMHLEAHRGDPCGVGAIRGPLIRFVRSGGTFSVALERTLVSKRQGRVLLLTGGIGITPSFASITEMIRDDFVRTSGPSVHFLHFHVDSSLSSVPFLPELLTYRQEMRGNRISSDPMTYNLMLYITRQKLLGDTASVLNFDFQSDLTSQPSEQVLRPATLTRTQPIEDPLMKGFGSERLKILRTSPTAVDSTLQSMEKDGCLHFGRRPSCEEVLKACKLYLGSTTDNVVFLCGPNTMIEEWSKLLCEAGVSSQNIISERFDF